jgi:ADP-ribosyl-[dinitrogen reductase] hydrolase
MLMLDKIKGGLIGFAIGDAMGVATEFMTPGDIKEKYGIVKDVLGGGVFNFKRGETSDDTAMTMAVAEGIIANSLNPVEEMGKQFLKWRDTQPKDIGITIRNVFWNYKGDWLHAAETTHKALGGMSGGNGTLMRCLPIVLAYTDLQKIEELTIQQSKMTHYDDVAAEACVIYNRIAKRLLDGEELKKSILTEIKNTPYDLDYSHEPNCPPSGYVVHTMRWVIYWLLTSDTFSEVVISATNKGGDSDTIAAIAGGLKGIEIGYNKLPFSHRLKQLNYYQEVAEVLYEIRDKDTLIIQNNQLKYLNELEDFTNELCDITEQDIRITSTSEWIERLKVNVYLYRASLRDDDLDYKKKYGKWWNVCVRFRRSRRLIDLGAPKIIIQHELSWLKFEVDHLSQIHRGIEPQYTKEELEDLESLAEVERMMKDED